MNTVKRWLWLPPTALGTQHSIYEQVGDYDATLFIWDEAEFDRRGYSKKRKALIFKALENLTDKNLHIVQGESIAVLSAILNSQKGAEVVTLEDTNQPIQMPGLTVIPRTFLVKYPGKMPPGYFKFWNKAKKQLLKGRS